MKLKSWLFAMAMTASVAGAGPSMYCRDCPFPAKIADGRWLMPNGLVTIDIEEIEMPKRMNQVNVTLRDAKTGSIIAKGVVYQRKDRRTVTIDLMDREGHPIKGFVHYVEGREKIQAKFTCEACAIGPMLE